MRERFQARNSVKGRKSWIFTGFSPRVPNAAPFPALPVSVLPFPRLLPTRLALKFFRQSSAIATSRLASTNFSPPGRGRGVSNLSLVDLGRGGTVRSALHAGACLYYHQDMTHSLRQAVALALISATPPPTTFRVRIAEAALYFSLSQRLPSLPLSLNAPRN